MSIKHSSIIGSIILILLAGSLITQHASAQSEEQLELRLSRDFGYSMGSEMQGTFSMRASGPESLVRVVFYIDGKSIGEDSEPPFRLRFVTDNYPLGVHQLSAEGFTADGSKLVSNTIQGKFVAPGEGMAAAGKILIPILVVIAGAMLLSFLPVLMGRGKEKSLPLGTPRNYGISGGTICPKCNRPFSMHLFGLNLLVGKLDRCPNCGRWSIVRHYPLNVLRAAEAAELELAAAPEPELLTEEERLRRDLDRSRYEDV